MEGRKELVNRGGRTLFWVRGEFDQRNLKGRLRITCIAGKGVGGMGKGKADSNVVEGKGGAPSNEHRKRWATSKRHFGEVCKKEAAQESKTHKVTESEKVDKG